MKVDITPAQLKAIKEMTDTVSSTLVSSFDEALSRESAHQVKMVDAFLKRNNLPRRDYK